MIYHINVYICLLVSFQDAEEYTDLPVRHNEDHMNSELAKCLPLESNPHSFDSPHTKAHLLLQAHLSRAMLPCPDYDTDTKTVLDQALRVCQVWKSFLIPTFSPITSVFSRLRIKKKKKYLHLNICITALLRKTRCIKTRIFKGKANTNAIRWHLQSFICSKFIKVN